MNSPTGFLSSCKVSTNLQFLVTFWGWVGVRFPGGEYISYIFSCLLGNFHPIFFRSRDRQISPFPCTPPNIWLNYVTNWFGSQLQEEKQAFLAWSSGTCSPAGPKTAWLALELWTTAPKAFSESLLHRLRAPCPEAVVTLFLLYPWTCVFVPFSGREIESEKHGRRARNNVQIGKH